jgi:phosphoribosylformylglycinamidine (FGAM) synthase-like enzyme
VPPRARAVRGDRRSHRRTASEPDDAHFNDQPIDLPLDVLLGKTPKMTRDVQTLKAQGQRWIARISLLPTR